MVQKVLPGPCHVVGWLLQGPTAYICRVVMPRVCVACTVLSKKFLKNEKNILTRFMNQYTSNYEALFSFYESIHKCL